jgi:hypothetical protein
MAVFSGHTKVAIRLLHGGIGICGQLPPESIDPINKTPHGGLSCSPKKRNISVALNSNLVFDIEALPYQIFRNHLIN